MTDSSISILNRSITSHEYDTNNIFEKFTFQSVITKLEKPVGKGCPVYIMNKSTGQIIYKTETDEKSTIYVPNLRKYNKYLVIATDIQDVYNTVAFDINWDFSKDAAYNYTLDYYDVSDLDNIQSIFEYLSPTKKYDPDVVSSYSIPLIQDTIGLSWSSSGNPRRDSVRGIPGFYFNGASSVSLPKGVFYQKLPFTFETYFKILENTGANQFLLHQTVNGKSYTLHVDSTLNLVFSRPDVVLGLSPITMMSKAGLSLNKDYHVAICFDGSLFYLFLNGVLQTTVEDTNGIPYINTPTIIGYQCKAIIANPVFTQSCKYTTDFSALFIPFSYNPIVYNDSSDAFAKYVTLLIKNNKITNQVMIQDKAKNIRFDNNITEVGKNYFNVSSTYNSTITSYSSLPLGTRDFCLEMSFKVMFTSGASPTLASNASTVSEWTTNIWYLLFNSQTTPNKYTFSFYGTTAWAANYPPILREQVDIAIVREGTKLRMYFNGFLDSEFTIASNFSLDSRASSFFSFGREIGFNLYDLKLTMDNCRYKADYKPALIDISDKDLLATQYQYAYLPFKRVTIDTGSPLTISNKDLTLSAVESINGTRSASFNGTSTCINIDAWYTSQEMFSVEMFLKPLENTNPCTLFSLYSTTAELINIGIQDNKLGYYLGTTWIDFNFTFDLAKFNHVVIKRDGTELKILAEGSLRGTVAIPAKLGSPLKVCIGASKGTANYYKGYLNNLYIYKNYIKYTDTYTVPTEEIVIDPEDGIEPEVIVNQFTTAALDFEDNLIDRIPTTIWTKTGTADVTESNVIFGKKSFETKTFGDSITLPNNHIDGTKPYTIDFYMLYKAGLRGSSRTDDNISLFSKNTGTDKYLVVGSDRTLGWTLPNYNTRQKVRANDITHYTYAYDGAATRIFINDKLVAIGGGAMDFANGYPLTFGHHEMSGYPNWAFGTAGLWDNFNIFQGVATKVRDIDPNEDYLVCDLSFEGADYSNIFVDNAPTKPTWVLDGGSSYVSIRANSSLSRFKTGYSFFNKTYYNNSTIKSTNVDLNFGTGDWTLSYEFIKNDDAIYCNFISSAASNYTTDADRLFYFCVMGSGYTGIPSLQKKLAFFNEKYLGQDEVKNSVISNPYGTKNVLVSKTIIQPGVPYKVDVVFKSGVMNLYINGKFDTSIAFDIPINLSPSGMGTTIGGVPFSNEAGLNGSINYIKVYKGIAIVPTDVTESILLEFQNDVSDFHSNSSWTASGLSYDSFNSIKGSSAVFQSSTTIYSKTSLLDFGSSDFRINYDIRPSQSAVSGRYALTNDLSYMDPKAIWFFGDSAAFDYADRPPNTVAGGSYTSINQYYNLNVIRKGKTLHTYVNDVQVSTHNLISQTFDFSRFGTGAYLGRAPSFGIGNSFNGYLDNFKSVKNYSKDAIINTPALSYAFAKNSINTGYISGMTSTDYGTPIYTVIGDKGCVKTENGKYINISATNALNLSTDVDFYMEIEFYKISGTVGVLMSDFGGWMDGTTYIGAENGKVSINVLVGGSINNTTNMLYSSNTFEMNTWNKLKIFRKGSTLSIDLNGVVTSKQNYPGNINFSKNGTCFGTYGNDSSNTFNGYLANFRLFTGVSELPEKYDPYSVINLDFSPTNKSYLFKDNYNKCIIHPFNITQRDYKDGEYCCTFNGSDTHFELGKNNLLNFGTDDFILRIQLKPTYNTSTALNYSRVIAPYAQQGGLKEYIMVPNDNYGTPASRGSLMVVLDENSLTYLNTPRLSDTEINDVILQRIGNQFTLSLNDVVSVEKTYTGEFNLNRYDNTIIGASKNTSGVVSCFLGTIYKIQALRNTTDLSLLDKK
jgi:hypothetical protein